MLPGYLPRTLDYPPTPPPTLVFPPPPTAGSEWSSSFRELSAAGPRGHLEAGRWHGRWEALHSRSDRCRGSTDTVSHVCSSSLSSRLLLTPRTGSGPHPPPVSGLSHSCSASQTSSASLHQEPSPRSSPSPESTCSIHFPWDTLFPAQSLAAVTLPPGGCGEDCSSQPPSATVFILASQMSLAHTEQLWPGERIHTAASAHNRSIKEWRGEAGTQGTKREADSQRENARSGAEHPLLLTL